MPGALPSSSPRPRRPAGTRDHPRGHRELRCRRDPSLDLAAAEDLVADLTRQYRFFHWHVEFPHIFRVGGSSPEGWTGGFSCVIGNPPWDQVQARSAGILRIAQSGNR